MKKHISTLLASFLTLLQSHTLAFNMNGFHRKPVGIALKISNDDHDFGSSSSDSADSDGKDLAEQFYRQVKMREAARSRGDRPNFTSSDNNDNASDAGAEESYEINRSRQSSQRKFTGRRGEIDSTGTPSAGLFASENGSVYAYPVDNSTRNNARRSPFSSSSSSEAMSPRDRMMRDEINFMRVASSEATIVAQIVLVLILLAFTIYVGSTGGITDGSDRFGTLQGVANEYNGLGESIDFSSLINDDASVVGGEAIVKEGSLWL